MEEEPRLRQAPVPQYAGLRRERATPTRCCSSTIAACSPSISAAATPTTARSPRRLREGAGPSLSLTVPLFVFGLVVSVAVALFVAFFRETYVDRLMLVVCMLTMSVASLLYIIAGQFLVGQLLKWFPISGFDPNPAVIARFLALPVLVGVVSGFGADTRLYRTIFLEEIEPRLRAHRPRQGLRGRTRHGAARAAQRADPDPHQCRGDRSRFCSPARCCWSPSSAFPASAP